LKKWANHEKIVVIDETRAYVGGIDACWGRYDTPDHPIFEKKDPNSLLYYPGIDYSNVKFKDFTNVGDYKHTNIDRSLNPRLPWHDICLYIYGPSVIDITKHFMQRWHFAHTHINTEDDPIAQQG
jgi:phosphatidylserine/phosphatidylglycerophosphate/cardiolipin synthase-like enzyme